MSSRPYRYGIIGTGRPWKTEGATGFGMAHPHYKGFVGEQGCRLAAVCDINPDAARVFLDKYDEKDAPVYSDYREMLAKENLDVVSVTLWPHLHAEMTVAACEAGVKAVHCEKPMATSWGDAKRMKAAAEASGTVLTFNHQRRFNDPFRKAKELVAEGAIGDLKRIEGQCGDLYDWGTHWFDMFFFYLDETPAEWVIAAVDSREEKKVFGADVENQGLAQVKFANGVHALLFAGDGAPGPGHFNRLIGTDGTIEVGAPEANLRVRGRGDLDWRVVETSENIHGPEAIDRACADLLRALDEPGYRPLLRAENALRGTEVMLAAYHSARIRGRVDLPLQADDNAFLDLLKRGEIGPNRSV